MIDRLAELLGILENEDEREKDEDEDVVEAGPLTGPGRRETAPAPEETEPPEKAEETELPGRPAKAGPLEKPAMVEPPEMQAEEEFPKKPAKADPPGELAKADLPEMPVETKFPRKPAKAESPGEPAEEEPPKKQAEAEFPEKQAKAEPVPETFLEDGTASEKAGAEVPVIPEVGSPEPVPEELARAVRENGTVREARSGASREGPGSFPWEEPGGVLREGGGMADPLPVLAGEVGPVPEGAAKRPGETVWPPASEHDRGPSGLEVLYRAAARAVEPAFEMPAAGQSGDRALPDPVLVQPARISVEELDRAMRRDSRRYDGGMTIY